VILWVREETLQPPVNLLSPLRSQIREAAASQEAVGECERGEPYLRWKPITDGGAATRHIRPKIQCQQAAIRAVITNVLQGDRQAIQQNRIRG
jgi:hypothetical protein